MNSLSIQEQHHVGTWKDENTTNKVLIVSQIPSSLTTSKVAHRTKRSWFGTVPSQKTRISFRVLKRPEVNAANRPFLALSRKGCLKRPGISTSTQHRADSSKVPNRQKTTPRDADERHYLELVSCLLPLDYPLLSLLFRGLPRGQLLLPRFLLAPAREHALLPRELALQMRGVRARALGLRQAVGGLGTCLGVVDQPLVLHLCGLQPVKQFVESFGFENGESKMITSTEFGRQPMLAWKPALGQGGLACWKRLESCDAGRVSCRSVLFSEGNRDGSNNVLRSKPSASS
jgi:hypothetical protein